MSEFSRTDAYRVNTLAIVRHHKKYCQLEDCTVILFLLREMAEKSGVKFSEEEKELFL